MNVLVKTTSGNFEMAIYPGLTALGLIDRTIKRYGWLGTPLDYEVYDKHGNRYQRGDMIIDQEVFVTSLQPVDA